MSYFKDIDTHMTNVFNNAAKVTKLKVLPRKDELAKKDNNKLYKVDFAVIAVDVVDFKKLSIFSDEVALNSIMSEFTYGVTKIMKEFLHSERIDIQGDGIYAIYRINNKHDIDTVFTIMCALNTFGNHIKKKVKNKFDGLIKKEKYSYYKTEFLFGIGASYSSENYFSKVGQGKDWDLIFMGHSVNCANELAKKANRGSKPILFDNVFRKNLTDTKKKRMNDIGGVSIAYNISTHNEYIYGCDWILTPYNNFVNNSVK